MSSSRPPDSPTDDTAVLVDRAPSGDPNTQPIRRPPADSAPARHSWFRPRAPLTLRNKLVVGIVALIVGVCAVVGVTTEVFLSRYLTKQLDTQLAQANQAAAGGPDGPRFITEPCGFGPRSGGFGPPSVTAYIRDGQVVSAATTDYKNGCTPAGAELEAALLTVPPTGSPQTVALPGLDGKYRVLATAKNGVTVVSGLSTAQVDGSLFQVAMILLIVTGVALVAGAFAVIWIVGRSLCPLDRVAATARQVTTLRLDRGEVDLGVRVPARDTDTRTEVGQVGSALNQMLGHVSEALESRQESETRVRQFVADASHELRTPLASIRGYAELTRRGREETGPDTRHALGRIESEAERMTGMVEDLLLLARLDAGRPLGLESTDLSPLVIDAVSDARAADRAPGGSSGAAHHWRLELPEVPATVLADPTRIQQVLVNLLANARTHTPPGTTVTVRVREARGELPW